jgi:hypothetical protein
MIAGAAGHDPVRGIPLRFCCGFGRGAPEAWDQFGARSTRDTAWVVPSTSVIARE